MHIREKPVFGGWVLVWLKQDCSATENLGYLDGM